CEASDPWGRWCGASSPTGGWTAGSSGRAPACGACSQKLPAETARAKIHAAAGLALKVERDECIRYWSSCCRWESSRGFLTQIRALSPFSSLSWIAAARRDRRFCHRRPAHRDGASGSRALQVRRVLGRAVWTARSRWSPAPAGGLEGPSPGGSPGRVPRRSEEHTSELQ